MHTNGCVDAAFFAVVEKRESQGVQRTHLCVLRFYCYNTTNANGLALGGIVR